MECKKYIREMYLKGFFNTEVLYIPWITGAEEAPLLQPYKICK
jgi:hypothetical protein